MAKKITLKAIQVEGFNRILVKVETQTHRGTSFGSWGSNSFRSSVGVTLTSNKYVARDADDRAVICVRGSDASKDNNSFTVGPKLFEKLKAAVKEYNEYNADRCAAPAPAANRCAVIIG